MQGFILASLHFKINYITIMKFQTNVTLIILSLILLSTLCSCNPSAPTDQNTNPKYPKKYVEYSPVNRYIDYSPLGFLKSETEVLHREVNKTLEAKEKGYVFNDSLYLLFECHDIEHPDVLFLYIVSKEIGESRKVTNTRVGDTVQIMRHTIIEKQIDNPNGPMPLAEFKLQEYKAKCK